ncbi:MAG: hypothetical protein NC081_05390 [Roseburia sp.]|nr:hypothetical protein [Lachnospiraceae bacterium]MCM1568866.1 hypothetical protein [Roseburia sp.]
MNPEFYLISAVLLGVITLMVSMVINQRWIKEDIARAIKQDISSAQMRDIENEVSKFLQERGIQSGANIYTIGRVLNIAEGGEADNIPDLTRLYGPDASGTIRVFFQHGLPQYEKDYAFAYECGNRFYEEILAITKKLSYPTEQIVRYIADALLLPIEAVYTYLEEQGFRSASAKTRIKIVNKLSKIYGAEKTIILRRIHEVYMAKNALLLDN